MTSRCFILGAGFSKACGLPLASELAHLVFEHAFPVNDDFRPDIRENWFRFIRHLYPATDLSETWPDFEDLITILDEWAIFQAEYEGRDRAGEPLSPPHFKKVLLRHLALLLCETTAAASRTGIEQVKSFVRTLDLANDRIISFNWDALVEIACRELNIGVSYTQRPDAGLWLAKPHGSITLAEMSRREFDEAKGAINVRNVHVDWEHGDNVIIRADDPTDAANRIVSPFKETVLVEPTARKVYRSPWIRLQWRNALDMLRGADEICVIGFSLPSTDYRPRILLQAATLERNPVPSLRIVDPNSEAIGLRYREVLGVHPELLGTTWEKWLHDGMR